MEDINKVLDEFFNTWKYDKNSRYLSWEHCYLFFKGNKNKILNNDDMLDKACLHLASYLASWGMYRGSSNTLINDYRIHKNLIIELLENCSKLWGENIEWEDIKFAKEIIEKNCIIAKISPTKILTTKILLGVFACIPAYDTYFCKGLSLYNKNMKSDNKIVQDFKENSFIKLNKLLNETELKVKMLITDNKPYPPMRLLDAYFWWTGGGKAAYLKHFMKNKKTNFKCCYCNKIISNKDNYCKHCGTKLNKE